LVCPGKDANKCRKNNQGATF